MACVEECISERESRRFEEDTNTKVKLYIFINGLVRVEVFTWEYICDAGSRLLFNVLGSELWESMFDGLRSLQLVKEYIIIDVWEIRKHKLYDSDSGPGQQLHSRSSPGERNGKFSQNGKFGQNGKLGHSCTNVTNGKLYGSRVSDHAIVHLGLNVSSSTHNCGCVVDGGNAMAVI